MSSAKRRPFCLGLNVLKHVRSDTSVTILTGVYTPGGRLNKKDGLTRCGDSHVKDKTS